MPTRKRKNRPRYRINLISAFRNDISITLDDGSIYKGRIGKDGKPCGKGEAKYCDGSTYIGEWNAGKWHGEGTFSTACSVERCSKWLYGQANGSYQKDICGEQRDSLLYDGSIVGKAKFGLLEDWTRIEAVSRCGAYRFFHTGRFEAHAANGFGVQLQYFGGSAEGKNSGSKPALYQVGDWKTGELYSGSLTEAQSDGSWLRTKIVEGRVTSSKPTVFTARQGTSSTSILAIKTKFGGYTFQSRTEARWALVFKLLGTIYLYEPFTLRLEGRRRYTCDFLLPYQQRWIEIKGGYPTNVEVEKAVALCKHTEMDVDIFYGDVGNQAFQRRCCNDVKVLAVRYRKGQPPQRLETLALTQCNCCGAIKVVKAEAAEHCDCDKSKPLTSFIRLEDALQKARQYDFTRRRSPYFL